MLYLRHVFFKAQGLSRAEKRKQGSDAAHALLTELLTELKLPQRLQKTAMGRPFLENLPTVDFNLSHTEGLAVCALLQCENAPRVGVDAEMLHVLSTAEANAFAARFFAPCEQASLACATDPAACFTHIFTRKEAYAKYCGDGLGKHLSACDTLAPDFEATQNVRFYTYRQENAFVTLCIPSHITTPPLTALCPYTGDK